MEEIVPYIDWKPFFDVWSLRGRYPNSKYPKIFNDANVGEEAKKVFDEAQELLQRIVDEKLLTANGIVGLYPANSVGDDIELYEDDTRDSVKAKLYGLRQQQVVFGKETYACISDMISPKGKDDYIGMFAVSAGFGTEALVQEYVDKHDDYTAIMVKAIADRLAEAFAELLHEKVRTEYWGYSKDEDLTNEDKLKVKYDVLQTTNH